MNNQLNKLTELTIDELIQHYDIKDSSEIETLKKGKDFIDSAANIPDEKKKEISMVLIGYLLGKLQKEPKRNNRK